MRMSFRLICLHSQQTAPPSCSCVRMLLCKDDTCECSASTRSGCYISEVLQDFVSSRVCPGTSAQNLICTVTPYSNTGLHTSSVNIFLTSCVQCLHPNKHRTKRRMVSCCLFQVKDYRKLVKPAEGLQVCSQSDSTKRSAVYKRSTRRIMKISLGLPSVALNSNLTQQRCSWPTAPGLGMV